MGHAMGQVRGLPGLPPPAPGRDDLLGVPGLHR